MPKSKISKKELPAVVAMETGAPAPLAIEIATTLGPVFAAGGVAKPVNHATDTEHFRITGAGAHKLKGDHPMATKPAMYGMVQYAGKFV